MDKSKNLRFIKPALYIPALVFSFFFPPLDFREYQLVSLPFWITYAIYNLCLGIVYAFFMIKGVRTEKDRKSKAQKKRVSIILLPPVLFWMTSVFLTHPFKLYKLFKIWQFNAVILLICIIIFIIMAFKDGVMGLKLSAKTYNWNTDMSLINKGAEYTNHMLKNQTNKMEWCIENLKIQFENLNVEYPKELSILSNSVSALKTYSDKIKKYSGDIKLFESSQNLKRMIESALPTSSNTHLEISVPDSVHWICDKNHMTEVFSNILLNGIQAAQGTPNIGIQCNNDKDGHYYLLQFKDNGMGIDEYELSNIFIPYFTTKNTEKNFGLGLAYCKNVIEKHGGTITAKSIVSKGTTITIGFPINKVIVSEEENGIENKSSFSRG